MDDVATTIGHDLKFNVARVDDELFQIHLIVSKCFLSLMTRAVESGFKAWLIMRSAHPAAATAAGRFDHHRIAELFCDSHRLILCRNDSIAAGGYRHAGFPRSRTSSVLVTHRLHRTGGRADEFDVAAFADLDKMRVLGEKPVAWMNRVNIADLGRAHDPIDSQIALKARRRTDADRFISKLD